MWAVGAVATLLGAWQGRQARQIKTLNDQVSTLTGQVKQLTTWRTTATEYIGQLLFVMAQRGIVPPQPPESLGLTVTTERNAPSSTPQQEDTRGER